VLAGRFCSIPAWGIGDDKAMQETEHLAQRLDRSFIVGFEKKERLFFVCCFIVIQFYERESLYEQW